MMDYKIWLGSVSVMIGFVQFGPYIADTVRGKTRPHAFSWFAWCLPACIAYAAQIVSGGGAGSWATGATAFLCVIVFILSLFRGEKEITRLDWASFLLALAAIGCWLVTRDPLGSVVLVTIADLLAFVPTIRKSIKKPHEETLSIYAIGGLKWCLALFALQKVSLTTTLFPAAITLGNWLFIPLLLARRRALAKDMRDR